MHGSGRLCCNNRLLWNSKTIILGKHLVIQDGWMLCTDKQASIFPLLATHCIVTVYGFSPYPWQWTGYVHTALRKITICIIMIWVAKPFSFSVHRFWLRAHSQKISIKAMNFRTVQRQYRSINPMDRTVDIGAAKNWRVGSTRNLATGLECNWSQNKWVHPRPPLPLQPPKSSKALMSAQYILFRPFSPNSPPASCHQEIRDRADGYRCRA